MPQADTPDYQLQQSQQRLVLIDQNQPKSGAVYVDFLEGKAHHRRLFGGGKGQDIAKAIGLNKFAHPRVIDATAGLGRESFVLASLGCHVTLLERNPKVYALLADGLQRAQTQGDASIRNIIERMQLVHSAAQDYLHALHPPHYPDVIYLDPMFPQRQKSALVQKEMRFFHQVVGDDLDSHALLSLARQRAHKRIVVKRPKGAPWLDNTTKPAFVIGEKSAIRYDVYLPQLPKTISVPSSVK